MRNICIISNLHVTSLRRCGRWLSLHYSSMSSLCIINKSMYGRLFCKGISLILVYLACFSGMIGIPLFPVSKDSIRGSLLDYGMSTLLNWAYAIHLFLLLGFQIKSLLITLCLLHFYIGATCYTYMAGSFIIDSHMVLYWYNIGPPDIDSPELTVKAIRRASSIISNNSNVYFVISNFTFFCHFRVHSHHQFLYQ